MKFGSYNPGSNSMLIPEYASWFKHMKILSSTLLQSRFHNISV